MNIASSISSLLRIVCVISTISLGFSHGALCQPRKLGTNLVAVTDYSPQLPFLNLFLNSRDWLTQCNVGLDPGCSSTSSWDTSESALLDLDQDGWVRSLPNREAPAVFTSVATFWDLPAGFPKGEYITLYDGEGSIEYGLGARKDALRSGAGRDTISIDPANGGLLLSITSTDPRGSGDYIRNIRLVARERESLLASQTFSPEFLERLRPYQALRFMDWARTNDSVLSSWDARPKVTNARYSSPKGVPAETMIALTNTLNVPPWFNIPHRADDNFIRSFALLTKSSLKPELPVYVEYSNEAWNDLFSQGSWIEARGAQLWPDPQVSGFTKRINYYGRRSAELCAIWRDVFSDSPGRIICVVASQAANSWTASQALACPLWEGAPCASYGISTLAIAPYFADYIGSGQNSSELSAWTLLADGGLGNLFREISSGSLLTNAPAKGALSQSNSWIEDNMTVARQYGLELTAYEAGQHLVTTSEAANNQAITKLFISANRHSKMESIYADYLSAWNARGGSLLMHFNDIGAYSVHGSWGALEDASQTSSPKYSALWRYALGSEPPTRRVSLRVKRAGPGVISSPAHGILCGKSCSAKPPRLSVVKLSAKPNKRSRFKGWSGACRHSRPRCVIRMSGNKQLRGEFR